MRKFVVPLVLLSLMVVTITGCNLLNRMEVGEYLVLEPGSDLNSPAWLDGRTLVATTGYNPVVSEFNAATGSLLRSHTVDIANISRLNAIAVSPDKSQVAFAARYKGPNYDPSTDNLEEADYADIVTLDLAADTVTNLTEGSGNFSFVSYLSDSEVVYFEFDYSTTNQVTNRIITQNLTTGATTAVVENTMPSIDMDPQGDYYWWGKGSPDGDKLFACAADHPSGDVSFVIFDTDTGDLLFDGFGFQSYDEITSGDWLDEDTVIIAAGSPGDFSYYIIDISGSGSLVSTIALTDDRLYRVYGVNLSPDKTMVASHAAEHDASGVWLRNWLLVTRIAPPPES